MADDARSIVEDVSAEKACAGHNEHIGETLSPEEDRRLLRKIDMWYGRSFNILNLLMGCG